MPVTAADADSDVTLVVRVRDGDPEAFAQLVERYRPRVYVHALGIVASREDALDLAQEAFVRAFRARHTLDPARPVQAWLYQIVRRLCFNHLRDRKAHAKAIETDGPDWLAGGGAPASDPLEEVQRTEARKRVAAAIDGLPAHEREVLVLKEFEELKYREIADLLGIPVGTVMSRLYSARKRLADALENQR